METYTYNKRLETSQIQLGTTGNPAAYYTLGYNFALPGGTQPPGCPINPSGASGNNGNVIGYTYTDAANSNLSHSAFFVYDTVNRLACAQATGNSTYNLAYGYNQDGSGQYGNMTCVYNSYTNGPCPSSPLTFSAANNRITSSGYSYDAAGNLSTDGTYGYTFDGEERMSSLTGSGVSEGYTYNALGQMAAYNTASYHSNMVYDPAGQWTGEYNSTGGYWWGEYVRLAGRVVAFISQPAGVTVFLHKDMETSTHMVTGPSGSLIQDQVFYPWGQSWYSLGTWYQQEFGGLDFFNLDDGLYVSLSRTYNPTPGRWLSPDAAGLKAVNPDDPQTWNMYAYVRNNPTTDTDPTGEACVFGITIFGSWFGGTCESDSPPPPPPPPPPAPAAAMPGTPQNNLANAQANARANPNFQPKEDPVTGNTTTFCNFATCSAVEAVGGPTGAIENNSGTPNLANTAAQQLPNSSEWHEVSPQEAQNLANQGVPVVAVQANAGGHGHEATVAPELMPGLTMQLSGTPLISNVGARVGVMPASNAFSPSRPAHYYAPNSYSPKP